MFQTSQSPSSGGTIVFMRHLVLVIPYRLLSGVQDGVSLYTITGTKCRISTVVSPDDGPGEVRSL
jgi:hypothetical protein